MARKNGIVFIGGGGHCKSVLDAALRMNVFDEIVITDYSMNQGDRVMGCEVLGDDDELLKAFANGFQQAFITIGSIESTGKRRDIYERAKEIGFTFPDIIDPSAVISETAILGKGIFVGKNAVINSFADIGDMAIINTGAIIEHECKIGSFTHIAVNATVCGNSVIGNDSFIGAGTIVIQNVNIGNDSLIGAGSVVLKDVVSNSKIYGLHCGN